ncbi:lipocalin family protein [Aureivirga sp. CE67]|uniref:lipocalin family protein n=1 Tax=Aureivirga sp. CE67 TaxID=1788983 RepID=UPI0018C9FC9B|nr:lipocalin family protein [Aureivirga sp. CE67]
MKKILLFFVVATMALVSCSDDDDNNYVDPIIGNWDLYKIIMVTPDGTEIEVGDDCELQSSIYFKVNGDLTSNWFEEDDDSNCIETLYDGDWSRRNDGGYNIAAQETGGGDFELDIIYPEFRENYTKMRIPVTPDEVSVNQTYAVFKLK